MRTCTIRRPPSLRPPACIWSTATPAASRRTAPGRCRPPSSRGGSANKRPPQHTRSTHTHTNPNKHWAGPSPSQTPASHFPTARQSFSHVCLEGRDGESEWTHGSFCFDRMVESSDFLQHRGGSQFRVSASGWTCCNGSSEEAFHTPIM